MAPSEWFRDRPAADEDEDNEDDQKREVRRFGAMIGAAPSGRARGHGQKARGRGGRGGGKGGGKRPQDSPEAVLFVPVTPRGELAAEVRAAGRIFTKMNGGAAMKVVERVGRKIGQVLGGTDLWGTQTCGREDCLPCGREGGN